MADIACFLPCRAGSERVLHKNTKPFANFKGGLIELKLRQLARIPRIKMIYLSTDDPKILTYANTLEIPNLVVHERAKEFCLGSTRVEDLVAHAHTLAGHHEHILWTHVTTPFVNIQLYNNIIQAYFDGLGQGFDSLMTTTPLHAFLWNENGPINYDRHTEKWPRSQDLYPIHEINFGVQMAPSQVYLDTLDRIGNHPKLYTLTKLTGHDIDWPEDFKMAEIMLKEGLVKV